jgi:hypothetical protein
MAFVEAVVLDVELCLTITLTQEEAVSENTALMLKE